MFLRKGFNVGCRNRFRPAVFIQPDNFSKNRSAIFICNPLLAKMNCSSVDYHFEPVGMHRNNRTSQCDSNIFIAACANGRLHQVVKNKITRADFINAGEIVRER